MFERIKKMYEKLGPEYDYSGPPRMLSDKEAKFRIDFLQEELDEYIDACNENEMTAAYDALLDLIVVAFGCLVRHGFPYKEGMDAVMTANEQKQPGTTAKRGFALDLVKPAGWIPPERRLSEILRGRPEQKTSPKDDKFKTAYGLIPFEALEGVAKVFDMGCEKYGRHTWKNGLEWDRTYSALLRHLFAWIEGQDNDDESGLSHLDHALAQLLILRYYVLNNRGEDTRYE